MGRGESADESAASAPRGIRARAAAQSAARSVQFREIRVSAADAESAELAAAEELAAAAGEVFVFETEDGDWDGEECLVRAAVVTDAAGPGGGSGIPLREGELAVREISREELVFTQRIEWSGFGSDDYESNDGLPVVIEVSRRGGESEPVASVELLLSAEATRLRFIEVSESHQRRGIGGALLDLIEEHHGQWETHDLTDDGAALVESRSG